MGKRDRKGLAPGIKVARRSSASSEVAGGARAAAAATVFTGGSEQSDHCETALRGIEDIAVVLDAIAARKGRSRASLAIYDPYYCAGTVKEHFAGCGFSKVHNEAVDFYATIKRRGVPAHDVLVTNPPFSGDHINRAVAFAKKGAAPWCMLLPTNVMARPWYRELYPEGSPGAPVFVAPHQRYTFSSKDARNGDGAIATPLATMWFVGAGDDAGFLAAVVAGWEAGPTAIRSRATFAMVAEELPRRIRKLAKFANRKAAGKRKKGKVKERKRKGKLDNDGGSSSPKRQRVA